MPAFTPTRNMTFQFYNPTPSIGDAANNFKIEIYQYDFTSHTSIVRSTTTGITQSTLSTPYEIDGFYGTDMSVNFTASGYCPNHMVDYSHTNTVVSNFYGAYGLSISNVSNVLTVYVPPAVSSNGTESSTQIIPVSGNPLSTNSGITLSVGTIVTLPTFHLDQEYAPLSGFSLTHVSTTRVGGGSVPSSLQYGVLDLNTFQITSDATLNPYYENYTIKCNPKSGILLSDTNTYDYYTRYYLQYDVSPNNNGIFDYYFTVSNN